MQRKAYTSIEAYLMEAHPAAFGWVFRISEIAKHWPGYTLDMGMRAQQDCVAQAFESAKRIDSNNGIEVVIDVDEAVSLKEGL